MQISSSEGNPHTGSYMVQGKTETSIAKVFASYRQRTANLGWEEIGYERSRANKMVKATYRNKFDYFELSLSPLAGGTMVTIETFKEAQ